VLIYHRCRLGAAVAIRTVKIEGGDAMLAEGASESGAAADRSGCVISHTVTVSLPPVLFWDKRCATLEQETIDSAACYKVCAHSAGYPCSARLSASTFQGVNLLGFGLLLPR
jgi:hypothetical protein